jgi:hypothetical protein
MMKVLRESLPGNAVEKEFEKLIVDLLELEGLKPNSSFRPEGEEIDGSFVFQNRVFLFEAKWHDAKLPASTIYQFKGKVDGKLIGTVGIFLSISGFSSECIDALTYGKSINIILFNGDDFKVCIQEEGGFSKVLEQKVKIATEKGTPFYPATSTVLESKKSTKDKQVSVVRRKVGFQRLTSTRESQTEIVILVEGQGDEEIVSFFAEKIFEATNLKRRVLIRNAGGKFSMAQLANAIRDFSDGETRFILVADGDYDVEETRAMLVKNLENLDYQIVIPDPGIEVWFQQLKIYDRNDLLNMARVRKANIPLLRKYLLGRVEIDLLRGQSSSFNELYEALIR